MDSGPPTSEIKFPGFHNEKIRLLWTAKRWSLQVKLSFNVLREICSYFGEPQILPGIFADTLRLYDIPNKQTKHISLVRGFSMESVHCLIDAQTVLCVGGSPAIVDVYTVRLDSHAIEPEPSMLIPRQHCGILKYSLFVYVFGSWTDGKSQTSCEKYSLTERVWTQLPNMLNGRCAFTPCLYGREIYLACMYGGHGIVETFDLRTEQFKALPVRLPTAQTATTVSCIVDDELIVVSYNNQMYRWKVGSEERNFTESQINSQIACTPSNCPPLIVGREMFWVYFETGDLCVLQLDSMTLLTKVDFH